MKKYVGLGYVILAIAGLFVFFGLVTLVLSKGDLSAQVEFALPGKRRASNLTYSYPAGVTIAAVLSYTTALVLSAIAHIRGSTTWLVVAGIVGVIAAVWSAINGVTFGLDDPSKWLALLMAGITIFFACVSTIQPLVSGSRRG
ncbi:hypothetical protein [Labedella endophytica]|uniref:Uncharacterized protein n=1 Tax=Labedella endophytica TaxID=1523160 RepID=A0A433JS47_9MICO|nr:hypothetical protein [Labedella endophytica]RUR01010.1 hypothetical protein ELQ94_05600 [Labedella endophytica]